MKIDLHVHSRISKRSSVWILNKIGCAESYSDPREIYRLAKERGMDAVTITDHNALTGCLDIAHLPDTVTGVELTTYFPEDGCKIHVLVYGLTESQFMVMDKLRENVFDLVAYLNSQGLFHVMAHPLYPVSDRYTVAHFEKGLLLFRFFEMNGDQSQEVNQMLEAIVSSLNARLIRRLSERHGMEPFGRRPWEKELVGGSDDHSGLMVGKCFTKVPGSVTLEEFWAGLRAGGGQPIHIRQSTPLVMAYNLYSVAWRFYSSVFALENDSQDEPVLRFLERMLTTARAEARRAGKPLTHEPQKNRGPRAQGAHPMMGMFVKETQKLIEKDEGLSLFIREKVPGAGHKADFWFNFMSKVSSHMLGKIAEDFAANVVGLSPFDIFHALGAAGAMLTLTAPYYAAFSLYNQSRRLSAEAGERLWEGSSRRTAPRVAVFTDTFDQINGVAMTWRRNVALAAETGKDLTVVSCSTPEGETGSLPGVVRLKPARIFNLPEYPEQKIYIPPFLEALKLCYDQHPTHIHAATPGPMGLVALAAARIMGLPFFATYHTEIPQYSGILTRDASVEEYVWKYILWFYNQADFIFSPSQSTTAELVSRKISRARILQMPRGVDTRRFSPEHERPMENLPKGARLLYAGRVSQEKNLSLLARAFRALSSLHQDVCLVVAGDGPYLDRMKQDLAGSPAVFMGCLQGDELAKVYASCDVFVFPSATDTFGNVVLEAQASGLPVVVSDAGGPRENLLPGQTGLVVPANDENALVRALSSLVQNPGRARAMGRQAREYALTRSFSHSFEQYWEMYVQSIPGGFLAPRERKSAAMKITEGAGLTPYAPMGPKSAPVQAASMEDRL